MRQTHKGDSISIINRLSAKHVNNSRMLIPLCCLVCYQKIRPINKQDVKKLMNEFNQGYYEGDRVIYVSVFNRKKEENLVTPREKVWTNPLRKVVNKFKETLLFDPDLHQYIKRYFDLYKGNDRTTAWMKHIHKFYKNNPEWYIFVDCILLNARDEKKEVILSAMNDIN